VQIHHWFQNEIRRSFNTGFNTGFGTVSGTISGRDLEQFQEQLSSVCLEGVSEAGFTT
jgi:hypothetical protein